MGANSNNLFIFNSNMKKFLLYLLVFSFPLQIIVASYFVLDPFKVLYKYSNYYNDYYVSLNRDWVSKKMYIKGRENQKYNSFIFGSSRTLAFKTNKWAEYLPEGAKPFLFDANGEIIYGIWSKIKFIESKGDSLKNVLIIVCPDNTFVKKDYSGNHLNIKSPEISNTGFFEFHKLMFTTYFSKGFFFPYLDYHFFKTNRSYMNGIISIRDIKNDTVSNDLYVVDIENKIKKDSITFFNSKVFFKRDGLEHYYPNNIDNEDIQMLTDIKKVFKKFNTNYKIIISPLYNQYKLSEKDLDILINVFGKENVFDFSGVNEITNNKYNYFEDSHYRYHVGDTIMRRIYLPSQ